MITPAAVEKKKTNEVTLIFEISGGREDAPPTEQLSVLSAL
jgi:hypothetical protein